MQHLLDTQSGHVITCSFLDIHMSMQLRSGFYKAYAERMASWGYVVVQYNLPLLWIVPDANEV